MIEHHKEEKEVLEDELEQLKQLLFRLTAHSGWGHEGKETANHDMHARNALKATIWVHRIPLCYHTPIVDMANSNQPTHNIFSALSLLFQAADLTNLMLVYSAEGFHLLRCIQSYR